MKKLIDVLKISVILILIDKSNIEQIKKQKQNKTQKPKYISKTCEYTGLL